MGEAKRRAAQRVQSQQEVQAVRLREKTVLFLPDVYQALEDERAEYQGQFKGAVTFDQHLNAICLLGIERAQQVRLAMAQAAQAEAEAAKPAERKFAGADLLAGMAPAVERG